MSAPSVTISFATGLSSASRRKTAIVPGASEASSCSTSSGGLKNSDPPAPEWPCGVPELGSADLAKAVVARSTPAARVAIHLLRCMRFPVARGHDRPALLAEGRIGLVRRATRCADETLDVLCRWRACSLATCAPSGDVRDRKFLGLRP